MFVGDVDECYWRLFFFFFNDTATTEIYTLSLHDALPICRALAQGGRAAVRRRPPPHVDGDRKSTRLNSSHQLSSYAVFCLKKKNAISRFTRKSPLGKTACEAKPSGDH